MPNVRTVIVIRSGKKKKNPDVIVRLPPLSWSRREIEENLREVLGNQAGAGYPVVRAARWERAKRPA